MIILQAVPIPKNLEGSAMTMWSSNGLEFGCIFFASCFGWVLHELRSLKESLIALYQCCEQIDWCRSLKQKQFTLLGCIIVLLCCLNGFGSSLGGIYRDVCRIYQNVTMAVLCAAWYQNPTGCYNSVLVSMQVWADQGFWQSAIAARPSAAYKGYILGGLLW